jgi:hypothetical protein
MVHGFVLLDFTIPPGTSDFLPMVSIITLIQSISLRIQTSDQKAMDKAGILTSPPSRCRDSAANSLAVFNVSLTTKSFSFSGRDCDSLRCGERAMVNLTQIF